MNIFFNFKCAQYLVIIWPHESQNWTYTAVRKCNDGQRKYNGQWNIPFRFFRFFSCVYIIFDYFLLYFTVDCRFLFLLLLWLTSSSYGVETNKTIKAFGSSCGHSGPAERHETTFTAFHALWEVFFRYIPIIQINYYDKEKNTYNRY